MVVGVAPAIALRPYTPADTPAVLELVAADRLPGQPTPTPDMLTEALEGRSPVDAGWWAELSTPATQVAVGTAGDVLGVVSYAVRPKDDAGVIVWLHCRENPAVADTLVRHAAAALGPRDLGAFEFATALTRGLEALPAGHRPATDAALRAAGFTGTALWRYMHTTLPRPGLPTAGHVRIGTDPEHPDSWKLEITRRGRLLAEALIGLPVQGIGVLWWITVVPGARGKGIGRALLGTALAALAQQAAAEAVLYVDDDAPGTARDRTAANRMYEAAGFQEIDRLHSYNRPRP